MFGRGLFLFFEYSRRDSTAEDAERVKNARLRSNSDIRLCLPLRPLRLNLFSKNSTTVHCDRRIDSGFFERTSRVDAAPTIITSAIVPTMPTVLISGVKVHLISKTHFDVA